MLKLNHKTPKYFLCLVLFIIFIIGLNIYKDYGLHWDEIQNQEFGKRWGNYVIQVFEKGDLSHPDITDLTFKHHDLVHGPAFEVFLFFLHDKIIDLSDSHNTILFRHLCTFILFFIGLIFFYLLGTYCFKNPWLSILGVIFLVLSPRIFAHAFYNSMDIPFLSFYIISMYTLFLFLEKKTIPYAILHAFTCAILIDIRTTGILIPIYTSVIYIANIFPDRKNQKIIKQPIKSFLVYSTTLIALIIFFWPLLWKTPFLSLTQAFTHTRSYQWEWPVLYLGKQIKATQLPWHYSFVWILISTPLLYIAFFLVGFTRLFFLLIKTPREFLKNKKPELLIITWLCVPLIGIIIIKPGSYDAWRHLFFIYPALLLISLYGLSYLYLKLAHVISKKHLIIARAALIFICIINMAIIMNFMRQNHPHQNVYFNGLMGHNMNAAKGNFELDYWGLSYRQALEFILNNDQRPNIKIYAANLPGKDTAKILPISQRKKITYVDNEHTADYLITNYRWQKRILLEEYHTIKVGNLKIMGIYKL
ncbi:MAG: glycosyltransferase family 39 protein [PVC group bacterium]|nr:glycosyltransferase family 39 protein [PVC group bacterium]